MHHITTPSISALESIDAQQLLSVSGGFCRKRCCPPPPAPPPPPTPVPTAGVMGPPPQQQQQMAGGDSVVNQITITNGSGTTTRTA